MGILAHDPSVRGGEDRGHYDRPLAYKTQQIANESLQRREYRSANDNGSSCCFQCALS
jgi:hypothetical protein